MTNRALMVIRATWNWLWGKPIDAGGEIAAQIGEDSIDDVAGTVQKLTESVGLQQVAFNIFQNLWVTEQAEDAQGNHGGLYRISTFQLIILIPG